MFAMQIAIPNDPHLRGGKPPRAYGLLVVLSGNNKKDKNNHHGVRTDKVPLVYCHSE